MLEVVHSGGEEALQDVLRAELGGLLLLLLALLAGAESSGLLLLVLLVLVGTGTFAGRAQHGPATPYGARRPTAAAARRIWTGSAGAARTSLASGSRGRRRLPDSSSSRTTTLRASTSTSTSSVHVPVLPLPLPTACSCTFPLPRDPTTPYYSSLVPHSLTKSRSCRVPGAKTTLRDS